ncbi:MAG: carboxypeptidase regulatory-like domain-containing protein [Rhodospirillales bacterium]|nr:MAG: carboxypeptidase regulatory-like domain-containing protein [Rhodospirillales bacterium]
MGLWVALAAVTPLSAQQINVRVTNADGSPAVGLKVGVTNDVNEETLSGGSRAVTDADGRAIILLTEPGRYSINVQSNTGRGFRYNFRSVTLTVGGSVSVEFNTAHAFNVNDQWRTDIGSEQVAAANAAADACDRAAYDAAVGELATLEASLQQKLHLAQRRFDAYRAANGLQGISTEREFRQMQRTIERIAASPVANEEARKRVEEMARLKKGFDDGLQAVEKSRERLAPLARARAQIKELKTSCGPGLGTTEFYAGFGAGPSHLQRAGGSFFRTEAGGVALAIPALRFANDRTVLNIEGALGARFQAPVLGATREVTVELRGWHMDSRGDAGLALFTPPGGATTGLFSPTAPFAPFGGYFTGSPLSDIRYRSTFQEFGGTLTAAVAFNAGGVTIAPFAGVRLARTTVDDKLSMGIGNPAFTTFEQRSDIGGTAFGPLVGASVRGDIGGGFYGFGAASAGLSFARARGHWQTFVPAVDPEARVGKLSGNKTAYQLDATAGVGFRLTGLAIELAARVSHGNGSPHLAFETPEGTADGTGGARIGFARQTTLGVTARGVVVF